MARRELSTRSAGVRRLLQEATELSQDDSTDYAAAPLESDLFTWHFTIRGPGGDFEGGIYHGKMVLPAEYPFKPPEVSTATIAWRVYMLTPSGRFETNKKICLSISSFHPESWQPSWGIRTALIALMAFFSSDPKGAVGSLDAPPQERRRLAKCAREFQCETCGFDASDPDAFPSLPAPAPAESSDDADAPVAAVAVADEPSVGALGATTTIFPTPRGGGMAPPPPPSPHAINHHLVHNHNDGGGGGPAPLPLAPQPQMQLPANPVGVQHRPPDLVGHQAAMEGVQHGGPGGGPLLVDRAILVVLLAILALIVKKIA
ncbi:hypothetical protein RQP46_009183 [Phenoliferia psychrophenolica]